MATTKKTGTRRGTTSAPLKNYLSEASLPSIMEAIRQALAEGGARRISFEYDLQGKATEITFALPIGDGQLATFRLPARQEAIGPLLEASYKAVGRTYTRGKAFDAQVERVAWANIRDWLASQVALIRAKMVKPQEVFLPYLLLEGYGKPLTYFEAFEQHRALPEPEQRGRVSISETR